MPAWPDPPNPGDPMPMHATVAPTAARPMNARMNGLPPVDAAPGPATDVIALDVDGDERAPHELASLWFAAARIAAWPAPSRDGRGPCGSSARFYVPSSTLSTAQAAIFGIVDGSQLWGGIVPHAFVGTKLVSHPLWKPGAAAPAGWITVPGIETCTLPGHAVFSRTDAREAGLALLAGGDIRLKCPYARGGNGQQVVRDPRGLEEWLAATDDDAIGAGLVIERDLARSTTCSIGCSELRGHRIAYHGRQRLVADRRGALVYGGSRLRFRRGGLQELRAELSGAVAQVARLAQAYDHALRAAYGVVASRCNYDVIVGTDARGQRHAGVLEQSWRFGGASMAEMLANEAFAAHPRLQWLVAETVETWGDAPLPDGAVLHWPGDARSPRKHARIVRHGR